MKLYNEVVGEYGKATPSLSLGSQKAQSLGKLKSWKAESKVRNQLAMVYLVVY